MILLDLVGWSVVLTELWNTLPFCRVDAAQPLLWGRHDWGSSLESPETLWRHGTLLMTASVTQETWCFYPKHPDDSYMSLVYTFWILAGYGWSNVSVMGMREWFGFHGRDAGHFKPLIYFCHAVRVFALSACPSEHLLDLAGWSVVLTESSNTLPFV